MSAQLGLIALNVEEPAIVGFELALNQEIGRSLSSLSENETWKYSPPELSTDTHGKKNSVILAPIMDSIAFREGVKGRQRLVLW